MIRTSQRPLTWIKILILLTWAVLFFLLLQRDVFIDRINLPEAQTLRQAEAEEYQGIYFRDSKIGYAVNRYRAEPDNRQVVEQEALMHLNIAQSVQTISLRLKATLSNGNSLQDFQFSFQSPFYRMQAKGTVHGNDVTYLLETGANTIRDTVTFPTPPLLATSRRSYLLGGALKPGEKRRIPWFDPLTLTGKESILEYRGQETILINGRVQKLHHFVESFAGARVNSWLNDSGTVVREESPAGFVFQKEPKFKALEAFGGSEELLSAMAVTLQGQLGDITGPSKAYRLTLPDDTTFDLDGGRQIFRDGILTITREDLAAAANSPACTDAAAALAATPYVQSDHPEITKLARQITGDAAEALARTRLIAAWVHENLDKRPVLGLPDALTTLQSRQGDCNEHAALFAALARAVAVPTRIAAGVTYHQEAFYYHAWNEVCLDNRWVSIDTTTNQFPADLTHLRFIIGETQEQVQLGSLLGKLSIEPLPSREN
ncbi:MAG: transglutaminase-like domain-containing protein [Desulforhopalus sp.]|nr:transglutaminase-like domain-containing protein [Desulforhopalus sp.]